MREWLQRYKFFLSDGRCFEWTAFRKAWQTRGYRVVPDIGPKREALLELARVVQEGSSWWSRYGWVRQMALDIADARRCRERNGERCVACQKFINHALDMRRLRPEEDGYDTNDAPLRARYAEALRLSHRKAV